MTGADDTVASIDEVLERATTKPRSASYLSPHQMHRLDLACAPVRNAFPNHGPYLVGSVNERADFRDVDVRVVLVDKQWDRMFGKGTADDRGEAHGDPRWQLLCAALSEWISAVSGLPVDFQIQRMTEANTSYAGIRRNPLGVRVMSR